MTGSEDIQDLLEVLRDVNPIPFTLDAIVTMSWGEEIYVSHDISIDSLYKLVNNKGVANGFITIKSDMGQWHHLNALCIGDVMFRHIPGADASSGDSNNED